MGFDALILTNQALEAFSALLCQCHSPIDNLLCPVLKNSIDRHTETDKGEALQPAGRLSPDYSEACPSRRPSSYTPQPIAAITPRLTAQLPPSDRVRP